ncbi:MAG: hypothetical protein NTY02_17740 [Acidobacteria bacterium]|nr:hypothetical protein [Acidobacteriota bacterium]
MLLAGLEHYFAGRHQEAINVWERVLFLDRGHARARTYIERARGAVAERLRRSEELAHEGVAALHRGDGTTARELLSSAVEQGDPHDMARAYLERLERLSARRPTGGAETPAGRHVDPPRALTSRRLLGRAPRPVRALPLLLAALVIGAAIFFGASRDWLKPLVDLAWSKPAAGSAVHVAPDALPVPGPAEVALSKARDQMTSGYLKAALATLDAVPDADPLAGEATRLRADIQRALLESLQSGTAPPAPARPSEERQP